MRFQKRVLNLPFCHNTQLVWKVSEETFLELFRHNSFGRTAGHQPFSEQTVQARKKNGGGSGRRKGWGGLMRVWGWGGVRLWVGGNKHTELNTPFCVNNISNNDNILQQPQCKEDHSSSLTTMAITEVTAPQTPSTWCHSPKSMNLLLTRGISQLECCPTDRLVGRIQHAMWFGPMLNPESFRKFWCMFIFERLWCPLIE